MTPGDTVLFTRTGQRVTLVNQSGRVCTVRNREGETFTCDESNISPLTDGQEDGLIAEEEAVAITERKPRVRTDLDQD